MKHIALILALSFAALAQQPAFVDNTPYIDRIVSAGGIPSPNYPKAACSDPFMTCGIFGQGSLITIYGRNLASTTAAATTYPWPTNLDGVTVTIGDVDFNQYDTDPGKAGSPSCRLLYVSPTQINALLPGETDNGGNSFWPVGAHWLTVSPQSGVHTGANIFLALQEPALFTLDAKGSAAALHANNQVVSASYPAAPGEYIALFATGLAKIANIQWDRPVTLYATVDGIDAKISYHGPSQYAGLEQVNIQIPDGVHRGRSVGVMLAVDGPESYSGQPTFNGFRYVPTVVNCQCIIDNDSNFVGLPIN
jgi:uncharacterized protein (TIGR03437 family)